MKRFLIGCFAALAAEMVQTVDPLAAFVKVERGESAAVRQIREKGYADQYKGDRRPVTLVGINFRAAKRNIDEPVFAKFS